MPFCLQCGASANYAIPTNDSRERLICPVCQYIHYENPKMVCGTLAVHNNKILLCRRAIEPRFGLWTLPAGFMENGETMQQGAVRETLEEANATAINARLYCLFDLPNLGQIHAMYLANLQDGHYGVGTESLECILACADEIDWENLAFLTVKETLKHYLADRSDLIRRGLNEHDFSLYPLHQLCIDATWHA